MYLLCTRAYLYIPTHRELDGGGGDCTDFMSHLNEKKNSTEYRLAAGFTHHVNADSVVMCTHYCYTAPIL